MAQQYTVGKNEYLLSIAKKFGFLTADPIVAANPWMSGEFESNFDVLMPGTVLTIPDVRKMRLPSSTGQLHRHKLRNTKKDLVITLEYADGIRIEKGSWSVRGNGIVREGTLPGNEIRVSDWPHGVYSAELKICLKYDNGHSLVSHDISETIQLYVGGLDPLTGSESETARAAQKLLKNLGLYGGDLDGDLSTDASKSAISKFKLLNGIEPGPALDDTTRAMLLRATGAKIGNSGAASSGLAGDRDLPLTLGKSATTIDKNFFGFASGYIDPSDIYPSAKERMTETLPQPKGFDGLRYFPKEAFVATSDAGTTQNPNVIRMKSRLFIFVDTGRWLKFHTLNDADRGRDFTVIYGRHVYLCQWRRSGNRPAPAVSGDRLDSKFFMATSGFVEPLYYATAYWAHEDELDWTKLVIVIPDLHLMTGKNGMIFRGQTFDLDPELDLLQFAKKLVAAGALKGKLDIVQLGDCYDLWVGCEPRLYKENRNLVMKLYKKVDQTWSCGSLFCPGAHDRPDALCAIGRWYCDFVKCAGHPQRPTSDPQSRCPDSAADDYLTDVWTCKRFMPPCPHHKRRFDPCSETDGGLWKCGKTTPPCPGHRTIFGSCKDIEPLPQLVKWVADIQGRHDDWVGEILELNPAIPAGIDLDELKWASGQGHRNPAIYALELLQNNFGLTILHGNHDNYLILPDVTEAAGISERVAYYEPKGILIEHGHRLEARLIQPTSVIPTNEDGAITGYEATNKYHHQRDQLNARLGGRLWQIGDDTSLDKEESYADSAVQKFQQPQYEEEVAQIWTGRAASGKLPPPHVFVMGHTHDRLLQYVHVCYNWI